MARTTSPDAVVKYLAVLELWRNSNGLGTAALDRIVAEQTRRENNLAQLVRKHAGLPLKGLASGVRVDEFIVLLAQSMDDPCSEDPTFDLLVLPQRSIVSL